MSKLLQINHLAFSYLEGRKILEDISFSLDAGEILSIIGPNGAGKSTLLGCLVGQLSPTQGEILAQGRPMRQMSRAEIARFIGFVAQHQSPTFGYDVRTFVVMGRTPYISTFRMPSREDFRLADEAIDSMGIAHLADRPCTEISGGERQQAAIARVVVQQPRVVVMDEPTSALDFGNQLRALRMVKKLAEEGYAVIMTTHNPDHAMMVGGQVAALDQNGRLSVGTAGEIIRSDTLSGMYQVEVQVPYVEEVGRSACLTRL